LARTRQGYARHVPKGGGSRNGQARRQDVINSARLLIVDDSDDVRAGLRSLVRGEPGLEIVGEANDGKQALEACDRLQPDLVLMDVGMPVMDGLTATRVIRQKWPHMRVLLFSLSDARGYVREAGDVGAVGYVVKGTGRTEILLAIRQALAAPDGTPKH
jgi:DNA-binding NarL/FixJ family response regulator